VRIVDLLSNGGKDALLLVLGCAIPKSRGGATKMSIGDWNRPQGIVAIGWRGLSSGHWQVASRLIGWVPALQILRVWRVRYVDHRNCPDRTDQFTKRSTFTAGRRAESELSSPNGKDGLEGTGRVAKRRQQVKGRRNSYGARGEAHWPGHSVEGTSVQRRPHGLKRSKRGRVQASAVQITTRFTASTGPGTGT